jgi:hypothetical protein
VYIRLYGPRYAIYYSLTAYPFPHWAGSVQHVFHHVVIKIRQLLLRPAACLTSTLLGNRYIYLLIQFMTAYWFPSQALSSQTIYYIINYTIRKLHLNNNSTLKIWYYEFKNVNQCNTNHCHCVTLSEASDSRRCSEAAIFYNPFSAFLHGKLVMPIQYVLLMRQWRIAASWVARSDISGESQILLWRIGATAYSNVAWLLNTYHSRFI